MYVKEPNEYEFFATYDKALQCCIRRHITLTNATGQWEVTQVPQPNVLKTKYYQHWTVRINEDVYQIVETDAGVFWVWNGTICVSNYDSGADYRPIKRSPPTKHTYWIVVRSKDPTYITGAYVNKSEAIQAMNLVKTMGGEYRSRGTGLMYQVTTYTVEVQE